MTDYDSDGQSKLPLIQKTLDSGPARPFDWDAFMERKFGPESDAIRN